MGHPRGPFVNCSYMDFNFLSTRWTFARRYYMRKRLLYSTFLMPHRFVFTQSLLCPYDMRNFTPIVKPMKKHRKPDKKANKRHLESARIVRVPLETIDENYKTHWKYNKPACNRLNKCSCFSSHLFNILSGHYIHIYSVPTIYAFETEIICSV